MYLLRWERAGAGRGACSAGIHQRGKCSFLNPSALCLEYTTLQWQVLTLFSLHTRAISHGLRLFSKRPSQSSTVVTVPSTRWLSPPSRGTRPCFQTSSSSGLAFCSSWVEEKFSRGQRRKPSVLVPSDGKSCHWVVIAFFFVLLPSKTAICFSFKEEFLVQLEGWYKCCHVWLVLFSSKC